MYSKNGISIYCGDCFSFSFENKFDLVLTDPPYNITACDWEEKIDLQALWQYLLPMSNLTTVFAFTCSQPFTSHLALSNQKMFRYEWIWEKNNSTGFLNANRRPLKSHENVLVFYKKLGKYFPQKTPGKPYTVKRGKHSKSATRDPSIRAGGYTTVSDGTRYPRSVLKIDIERGLHETQKPVKLMEYMILTYTEPGDIVFDPFMGSGTTLVAAKNLGRLAIGIDKLEKNCLIAIKRLEE